MDEGFNHRLVDAGTSLNVGCESRPPRQGLPMMVGF
jgi:hypothetical protein